MTKIIDQTLEMEFLISATPYEVLKYCKNLWVDRNQHWSRVWHPDHYYLNPNTFENLYERNDRTIDIALCLVSAEDDQVSLILNRNTKEGKIDNSVLCAALSNRNVVSDLYEEIPRWLRDRINWIVNHGEEDAIHALFEDNTSLPNELANLALYDEYTIKEFDNEFKKIPNNEKWYSCKVFYTKEELDNRRLRVISATLRNKRFQRRNLHTYFDISKKAWNLLITLPVSEDMYFFLSRNIKEISYHQFRPSEKWSLDNKNNLMKFIDLFLERWGKFDSENDYKILKNLIIGIDDYHIKECKDFLLAKNENAITEGFFSSKLFSSIRMLWIFFDASDDKKEFKEMIEKYEKKYSKYFYLGLLKHDWLFKLKEDSFYSDKFKIILRDKIFEFNDEIVSETFRDKHIDLQSGMNKKERLENNIIDFDYYYDSEIDKEEEKLESNLVLLKKEILEELEVKIEENHKEIINCLSDNEENYIELKDKNIDASQRIEEQQYNFYQSIVSHQKESFNFLIIIIILLIIIIIMLF